MHLCPPNLVGRTGCGRGGPQGVVVVLRWVEGEDEQSKEKSRLGFGVELVLASVFFVFEGGLEAVLVVDVSDMDVVDGLRAAGGDVGVGVDAGMDKG